MDLDHPNRLQSFLQPLIRNDAAVKLLVDLWIVIQAWDDAYDDEAHKSNMPEAFRVGMIDLHENPLFLQLNMPFQIKQMYLKWMAANRFEEAGEEYHKAYMLRAAYYDIVLMVIAGLEGTTAAEDKAPDVYRLYGETFEEYKADQCQV